MPKFLRFFFPCFVCICVHGQYTPSESPISEGGTSMQITLPHDATTSIYRILKPPYDAVTGNVVGQFVDANSQTISSTATFFFTPSDPDYSGTFYVDWNGTDSSTGVITENSFLGSPQNDYLVIVVSPSDDEPVLYTGLTNASDSSAAISYEQNEGTTFVAYASATDADGGSPTITITGGADQNLFSYSGGQILFNTTSGFDYEFPQDSDSNNQYIFEVTAADANGSTDMQEITLSIAEVNDAPTIVDGNNDLIFTIDEDESPIAWSDYTLLVSDLDSSDFTWSISSNAQNGAVTITDNNDECTVNYVPDADMWGIDTGATPTAGQTGVADKFTIQVIDDRGGVDEITFRVKVSPVNNDDPVITHQGVAVSDPVLALTLDENSANSVMLTAYDFDDGSTLTWSLSGGNDSSSFNIIASTGELQFLSSLDIDFEASSSYDGDSVFEFAVTVTDEMGQIDSQDYTLSILDLNEAPIISPTSLIVVMDEDNASSFIAPFTAEDPDLYSANSGWRTLTWSIEDVPSYGTAVVSGSAEYTGTEVSPTTISYTPNPGYSGTDFMRVRVEDEGNSLTSKLHNIVDINITILQTDDLPVFSTLLYDGNASVSLQVSENSNGDFQVSATDPDGGDISYSIHHGDDQRYFEVNGTTGWVRFLDPPNFENRLDLDSQNTYEVTIEAYDSNGSSFQNFTIQVVDVFEPATFVSDSYFLAPEKQLEVGAVAVSDVDSGDSHSFFIVSQGYPDDSSKFAIDADTGEITFINLPDFEANASYLGSNLFNFIVQAVDSGGVPSDLNVSVELTDDNDAPTIETSNNASLVTIAEDLVGGQVFADFNVTDQDQGQTHSWVLSGDDSSFFIVDSSTGELSLLTSLDYEIPGDANIDNYYELSLVVTDSHGSPLVSNIFDFQVLVSGVNEPPYLSGTVTTSVSMNEDDPSSFISPAWSAIDPETNSSLGINWFLWDEATASKVNALSTPTNDSSVSIGQLDGVLTFNPLLNSNRDMNGSEILTVIFEDEQGVERNQTIQINVLGVNDPPEITGPDVPFVDIIDHNESVLEVIDFEASDFNDLGDNNIHYTQDLYLVWNVSGEDADLFDISNQGRLSFKTAPVYDSVTLLNNRYEIIISVKDEYDGVSDYPYVINVTNSSEPPALLSNLSTVFISEDNAPISWEDAWEDLQVEDPDGGSLTWEISINASNGEASVDLYSGAIMYSPNKDYFGVDSFSVKVTDEDELFIDIPISVDVAPINDPPSISDADDENRVENDIILVWENNVSVTSFIGNDLHDVEFNSTETDFLWSLDGTSDASHFTIDSNAVLKFRYAPDYESPLDEGEDNLYSFSVLVTDDSDIFGEYLVRVRVRNKNEPPVYTSLEGVLSAQLFISENTTFVYMVEAQGVEESGQDISFDLSNEIDNNNSLFEFDSFGSNEIFFKDAPDFENPAGVEGQNIYILEVNASDGLSSEVQRVEIVVTDNNEPLGFKSDISYVLDHNESSTSFILDLSQYYTDSDTDSSYRTYIFSLDESLDSQFFLINSTTGEITFDESFTPDFESPLDENGDNKFIFSVNVEDGQNLISQEFSIQILDVNDLPNIIGADLTEIIVPENQTFVSKLEAFDQDSKPSYIDLAIVVDNESISWLENSEQLENRFLDPAVISEGIDASFCAGSDFDLDGDMDVLLLEADADKVTVFENNGSGGFTQSHVIYSGSESNPQHALIKDLNEDGYPDVIVALKDAGRVIVLQSNPSAPFDFVSIDSVLESSNVVHVDCGDIDGDGDIDIIATGKDSTTSDYYIHWFSNGGEFWFTHSNEQLTFSGPSALTFSLSQINQPKSLSLGDVDQDGDTDLAVASSLDGNFSLFINEGGGVFGDPVSIYSETDGQAQGVRLVDLNADAKLDVVVTTKNSSKLGVLLQSSNGGGEFLAPSFFYSSSFYINSFDIGDIDGDGDLDLVAAAGADSNVRWFTNDGSGKFTINDEMALTDQSSVISVSLGDFSQTNTLLRFSIDESSEDAEHFVFRPKYSGNLYFRDNPNFEIPTDADEDNQYEIKILVSDSDAEPSSEVMEKVVINVDDLYEAPVIQQPTAQEGKSLQILEHSLFVIDINATNDEGLYEDTFFSISGGLDAGFFTIDESTGVLSFISGPDYENPLDDLSDGNNSYHVVVRATDNGPENSFSEIDLYVSVSDGNDLPEFNVDPAVLSIVLPEDTLHILELSDLNASDPEGSALTWSIVEGGTIGDSSLVEDTLHYQPFDNINGSDEVILEVKDHAELKAQITIGFTITQVNDAPIIITGIDIAHPENLTTISTLEATDIEGDELSWSLSGGADHELFSLSVNGDLSFLGNPPDFETPDSNESSNFYEIAIFVSDGDATAEKTLTVEVLDVADIDPVIHNLDENITNLLRVMENELDVLDLNFSDIEGDEIELLLTGGSDISEFDLSQEGRLRFLTAPNFENPTDLNSDNLYEVDLNATDGINSTSRSLVVQVINANEDPPIITSALGTSDDPIIHFENQAFVIDLTSSDDVNGSISYALSSGADMHMFDLNISTGALSFKQSYVPDYETIRSNRSDHIYMVGVKVSDDTFTSGNYDLYIGISDVDEPPALRQTNFELMEDPSSAVLLDVEVYDPEGDPFEYDFLRSPDFGTLEPAGTGYLYMPDLDFNGEDTIQFLVVDDQNVSLELSATISVIAVNDPPTASDDVIEYNSTTLAPLMFSTLGNDSSYPDDNETIEITDWSKSASIDYKAESELFTYTPDPQFIGPFEFSYTLYDGQLTSTANVTIHVLSSPNLPGWQYLPGFGYMMRNQYPWVLHGRIGWLYISQDGGENSASWMWNQDIGWFWTGKEYFEHFFAEETQKWYYWKGGIYEPGGVLLFDFAQNKFIEMADYQKQKVSFVLLSLTDVSSKIEYISTSSYFSSEQKQVIVSELYFTGQSPSLENLLKED
ncbi:MAG: tandem-95 repeat protein [Opitutales bacterium]|nr:tandem-95 repeat protein [Opitutales bacterium]